MVDAVLLRHNHVGEQAREVARICRRADLVADDGKLLVRFGKAQHRLDEILAVFAEDPRDAHDEELFERFSRRLFAKKLRLAVDVARRLLILWLVEVLARAGKYIVRADVKELRADLLRETREFARRRRIHLAAKLRLVLCLVHCRIRRAVDDRRRPMRLDEAAHCRKIRQGEVAPRCALRLDAAREKLAHDVEAQLSAHARDKHLHRNPLSL